MKKKRKNAAYYIDNQEFFDEIIHCQKVLDGKCSEKLGAMFLKMTNGIIRRPNFVNYSFKEDMIGVALIFCIKAVPKFKPEFSKNAFGYFTKIIFRAFINQITLFKTKNMKLNAWIDKEYEKLVIENGVNFTPGMVQDSKKEYRKKKDDEINKKYPVFILDPKTFEVKSIIEDN